MSESDSLLSEYIGKASVYLGLFIHKRYNNKKNGIAKNWKEDLHDAITEVDIACQNNAEDLDDYDLEEDDTE